MPRRIDKKPVVLYHTDCRDGFGAAYAAWKKFGARAIYIPVPPNNEAIPKEAEGADVYTLDYSFPKERIPSVLKKAASLTIIDHHISNRESAGIATRAMFSLDHSGAVLAWMYFHPGTRVPTLLRYIEDVDLWRFRMPNARAMTEIMTLWDPTFSSWDKHIQACEKKEALREYIQQGKLLVTYKEQQMRRIVEYRETVRFEDKSCFMVNSVVHTSDIGHALLEKGSPIAIIWSRRGDKVIVSLRSKGDIDVSRIAEKYGGGGHKAAAGFSWQVKHFLAFKKKNKI